MKTLGQMVVPARITLVDDVVTQGATALAAASRVAEIFSDSEIGVFALVRTRGLVEDIDSIVDPVSGWIVERQGRAWRDHD
jgi:orotate phosphoribosyltransferase-like protein